MFIVQKEDIFKDVRDPEERIAEMSRIVEVRRGFGENAPEIVNYPFRSKRNPSVQLDTMKQ